MGFFIRDLHVQIQQLHKQQIPDYANESLVLYRGQGISVEGFKKMKNNIGQLVSFNGFLSTSKDEVVSQIFAQSSALVEGMVGILFVIKVNPKIESVPFANVTNHSKFKTENEYLFSMHSVFRMCDIKQCRMNEKVYEIELAATKDEDPELRQLINRMPNQYTNCVGEERLLRLLSFVGQNEEAKTFYLNLLDQQNLPIEEKVNCYHRLSTNCCDQGNYTEANKYLEKAISIQKQISLEDHPNFRILNHTIGKLCNMTGHGEKALIYLRKALEIHHKHSLANDRHLFYIQSDIGMAYFLMGNYREALKSYKETANNLIEQLGPNHPLVAQTYRNISTIYNQMGNHSKESLEYSKNAFEITQKTMPDNHQSVSAANNSIAIDLLDEKPDMALAHLQQAIHICQENSPSNHRHSGYAYSNLGTFYAKKYDYPEALFYFNKGLELMKINLSQNHPSIATVYCHIAGVYAQLEEYTDASFYYEKALRIFLEKLPGNHPNLETTYMNIGVIYCSMEQYHRALEHFKYALEIRKQLPENLPRSVEIHKYLMVMYEALGEIVWALVHLFMIARIKRRFEPRHHTSLLHLNDQLRSTL